MHPNTQPDRNRRKPSAKATIPLGFAQPPPLPSPPPLATPTSSNPNSNSNSNSNPNPFTFARESLLRDGYVILPASLFPSLDLAALHTASTRLTASARAGSWPYIRTLPKQFPPWPSSPGPAGIWGVQHLLHPSNPDAAVFANSYFAPELATCVATLIGCDEADLSMELYNLLVRPDSDFSLRWHRDDIPDSATPAQEEEALLLARAKVTGATGSAHAQWNLALEDDESLVLVPGSHVRARTQAERDAHPYEGVLPGQITVELKKGDVAFYDNNILHRGVYSSKRERMTLHGSMGTGGRERARNVLQHGVGEWVEQCRFEGLDAGCAERAERMRRKLVELGRGSGDVGFFAEDE